jgi:hypothetical protein
LTDSSVSVDGTFEILGMKWLPRIGAAAAKDLTPYEVGDRNWKSSVRALTAGIINNYLLLQLALTAGIINNYLLRQLALTAGIIGNRRNRCSHHAIKEIHLEACSSFKFQILLLRGMPLIESHPVLKTTRTVQSLPGLPCCFSGCTISSRTQASLGFTLLCEPWSFARCTLMNF